MKTSSNWLKALLAFCLITFASSCNDQQQHDQVAPDQNRAELEAIAQQYGLKLSTIDPAAKNVIRVASVQAFRDTLAKYYAPEDPKFKQARLDAFAKSLLSEHLGTNYSPAQRAQFDKWNANRVAKLLGISAEDQKRNFPTFTDHSGSCGEGYTWDRATGDCIPMEPDYGEPPYIFPGDGGVPPGGWAVPTNPGNGNYPTLPTDGNDNGSGGPSGNPADRIVRYSVGNHTPFNHLPSNGHAAIILKVPPQDAGDDANLSVSYNAYGVVRSRDGRNRQLVGVTFSVQANGTNSQQLELNHDASFTINDGFGGYISTIVLAYTYTPVSFGIGPVQFTRPAVGVTVHIQIHLDSHGNVTESKCF